VADNVKITTVHLAFAVLGVLAFFALMNSARASGISVGTFDANGTAKDTFSHLEDVRVIAYSSNKPITIRIFSPDNSEVYFEQVDSFNFDRTINGVTTVSGEYTVEAASPLSTTRKNFATVFFNVVPETPFGTLSIFMASLGAFGIYGFIKRESQVFFRKPF